MKSLLPILMLAVALQGSSFSQAGNDPQQVVDAIMHNGGVEGHDSKVLGPSGDTAAVAITKALSGKEIKTGDIDRALWILGQAFGNPGMVKNVPDRQPKTAFLLLRYFSISTTDPDLRKRIEETRQYIEDRYSKTTGKRPGNPGQ